MFKWILLLIFLFILNIAFPANTIPVRFRFEKFPYLEKLPSNSVIRIYNDKDGYMWFGTKDGLCRFDGYNIKVFRSSALTPGRLTNNEIQCIAEDNDHKLWIGTVEGITIIDKKNYTIKSIDHKYIKKERINSILIDSKGYVWIGTSNNGAIRMDPKTGKLERFSNNTDYPTKITGSNVTNIYEDKSGKIWLSIWKSGLCCIDQSRKHILYSPKIGNNNNPFRLYQDKNDVYWACTWGDGIFHITLDTNSKIKVHPVIWSKNSDKAMDNIVYSITQDNKYEYIWVVTFRGLRLIEKESEGIYKMSNASSFFDEATNKLFHEIAKDNWGNLWLGAVGDGLYKLDFNKLAIQNFPLDEIQNSLCIPSYVTHFCQLATGEIFITINRLGIFCFNPQNGKVTRPTNTITRSICSINAMIPISNTNEIWLANEGEDKIRIFKNNITDNLEQTSSFVLSDSNTPRENNITHLFEDSKGNVWIGTNNGLYIKPINSSTRLISSKIQFVNTIEEDASNKIWIGTEKEGVWRCTPFTHKQKTSYVLSKINLSINNYQSFSVQSICCKKNGDVFIGSKEGCIYVYDRKKNIATDISGLYGITEEGIMNILEDNFGILWISTIKKIIRYNPQTHASTYYSNVNDMLMKTFSKDAIIKLQSGQILFGGNKGICAFNPTAQSSLLKPKKQYVLISDILIQNKSIFEDEINFHFDSQKNRVTLQHNESNLSIEFCVLDYSSANKIQYAYMLAGVDNKWIYTGNNRRNINYANLPSGKYIFMAKASDENGLWSDQITSLEISILPPPYKTWWAYSLYLIMVGASSYLVIKTIVNRIRLKNELKISHIEKEKTEELAQIKLRYFTNISHELLTPLTIIMLVIEKLQRKNNSDSLHYEMIKTNANRLKRLIQQILVFRKAESGDMKLKISKNDIIAFVDNICKSNFQPLIIEKKINFQVRSEEEYYLAYFDPDKLDKVLYNLLSNAFKHSYTGGRIDVVITFITRQNNTILRLSVSDTGDGIKEEDLPRIFERFYTSNKSDPSQSHGIGLSLTSDLLQIHKGNIEVKSQFGVGSVFTIELPISKNAYNEEEFWEEESIEQNIKIPEIPDIIPSENDNENKDINTKNEDYTALVVEDNRDLKNLIVENIAKIYNVLSAENGKEALKIISEHQIDLIISDVMMPEMDGLTFCKTLKNNIATSHISILMLTARNSNEDRIDCYNAGADAYIAKPFEFRMLVARAKNLIEKRKQITNIFQKNQEINISSLEFGSIDEAFLKQAVIKVETKLADESFDFDQFALDMSTSKSTLHRKLKSLTGLSPGEFIRNIRLKHSSIMIRNNVGNISEIAYAVGFNDPKYFTRCFKTEFGYTPTEYQDKNK